MDSYFLEKSVKMTYVMPKCVNNDIRTGAENFLEGF